MRRGIIDRTHPGPSVLKQYQWLWISRSSFYYAPQGETVMNPELMLLIDKPFLEAPFYGVRQTTWHLQNEDHTVNKKRIRRLMRLVRVRRENSPPDRFLTLLTADLPRAQHQQGCEGVFWIWSQSWTGSPTRFCFDASPRHWRRPSVLIRGKMRSKKRGPSEIMSTDQGSQFLSFDWTDRLKWHQNQDLDGRQGPIGGQHLHQASLAIAEV